LLLAFLSEFKKKTFLDEVLSRRLRASLVNLDALSERPELFVDPSSTQCLPLSCHADPPFHVDDIFALSSIELETRTTRSAVAHAASLSSLARTSSKMHEPHRLLPPHARSSSPCSTTTAFHHHILSLGSPRCRSSVARRTHPTFRTKNHVHTHPFPTKARSDSSLSKGMMLSRRSVCPVRAQAHNALGGCYSMCEPLSAF
jgi:hypothetical protein